MNIICETPTKAFVLKLVVARVIAAKSQNERWIAIKPSAERTISSAALPSQRNTTLPKASSTTRLHRQSICDAVAPSEASSGTHVHRLHRRAPSIIETSSAHRPRIVDKRPLRIELLPPQYRPIQLRQPPPFTRLFREIVDTLSCHQTSPSRGIVFVSRSRRHPCYRELKLSLNFSRRCNTFCLTIVLFHE